MFRDIPYLFFAAILKDFLFDVVLQSTRTEFWVIQRCIQNRVKFL